MGGLRDFRVPSYVMARISGSWSRAVILDRAGSSEASYRISCPYAIESRVGEYVVVYHRIAGYSPKKGILGPRFEGVTVSRSSDYTPRLCRSKDAGNTWSEPRALPLHAPIYEQFALETDKQGRLWFFFTRGDDDAEIYYMVSPDGGQTWSEEKAAPFNKTGSHQFDPALECLDSGTMVVAYVSDETGEGKIHLACFDPPA